MKIRIGQTLLLGALCAVVLGAAPAVLAAADAPLVRLVIDAGWIIPRGDLGGDLDIEDLDLGQDAGYEIGARLRIPLAEGLIVAPGFHYVDFGANVVEVDDETEFPTEALSYRWTVEAMWLLSAGTDSVRPFLAASGGLYRNRVVGYYGDVTARKRDDTVNSFGAALRGGVMTHGFEFSVVLHINGVETRRWHPTVEEEEYAWDSVSLRAGYALPW